MTDDKQQPAPAMPPDPASEPDRAETPEPGPPASSDAPAGPASAGEEPDSEAVERQPEAAPSGEPASAAGSSVEAVPAPDVDAPVGDQRSDTFVWHPDHGGKTADEVRAGLAQEIASDQRQHRLAMDGAEESEQDALASVVSLERKWGPYDFDWAEQDPVMLADRITEFELERERRREMMSWSDYRNARLDGEDAQETTDRPAELSTATKGLALLLVILLIVVILLAVWAL